MVVLLYPWGVFSKMGGGRLPKIVGRTVQYMHCVFSYVPMLNFNLKISFSKQYKKEFYNCVLSKITNISTLIFSGHYLVK